MGWGDADFDTRARLLIINYESERLVSSLINPGCLLILGLLTWDQIDRAGFTVWIILATAASLGSYLFARRILANVDKIQDPEEFTRTVRNLSILAVTAGICWGIGAPLIYQDSGTMARIAGLFILALAAASGPSAAIPGIRWMRFVPIALMTMVTLATAGEWVLMAVAAGLFLGLFLNTAYSLGQQHGRLRHQLALEDQLNAQTLALERADATKSDFLAIVGHEIRTPMYSILGMVELLGETELGQRQSKLVDSLNTASDYLSKLLNNILDFSKLNAGKKEVEAGDFNLFLLIENVIEIIRPTGNLKGLKITQNIAPKFPRFWNGDYGALNQITVNLLANAVKYTNDGTVNVSLDQLDDGGICLKIADTGPGIEEADLPRIFDPFMQAKDRYEESRGGVGLGLAICKGLIDQLEGTIELSSEVGVGTTVEVRLPFVPAESSSEATDKPFNFDLSKLPSARVLVVDDTDLSLEATLEFLSGLPFIFDAAMDGQEALELYQSRNYDLVLSDLRMPGLSGLELIQKIREFELERRRRKVPIIILTAAAEHNERTRALNAGCSAFLVKPIRRDDLVRTVASYIGVQSDQLPEPSSTISAGPDPILESLQPKVMKRLVSDLQNMSEELASQDFDAIYEMAHAAKGYCAVFGLSDLSMVMDDILTACTTQDYEAISSGLLSAGELLAAPEMAGDGQSKHG